MRFLLIASLIFLQGCGIFGTFTRKEKNLATLSLGDSRGTVLGNLGAPDSSRAAKFVDKNNLQIDEYILFKSNAWAINAIGGLFSATVSWWLPKNPFATNTYWLQYVDGKLTQWNKAGDWSPNFTADLTVRQK